MALRGAVAAPPVAMAAAPAPPRPAAYVAHPPFSFSSSWLPLPPQSWLPSRTEPRSGGGASPAWGLRLDADRSGVAAAPLRGRRAAAQPWWRRRPAGRLIGLRNSDKGNIATSAAATSLPRAPQVLSRAGVAVAAGAGRAIAEKEPGLSVSPLSVRGMLAAGCLSLLGFTMPTPILPQLRDQFGLTANQVGMVSSSFAAGMFFAVMILPGISDTCGRRPVVAAALLMTSLGFLAQGLSLSLGLSFETFLWARLLTGLFAGCNPIFKAYLADVCPPNRLPQFMVYREASATLAFVIGPSLGGFLASSALGSAGPLLATAAAHLVACGVVAGLVEESVGARRASATKASNDSPEKAEEDGDVKWLLILLVFAMSFVYVIGQTCFSAFFPLLMTDRFGDSPRRIGVVSTAFSLVALAFQVFGYRPVHKRLGLFGTGALGALCIGLGLAGLGTAAAPLWVAATAYALGVASFPATIPTLLAGAVPSSRRGLALGVDSIVNNLCRVIAPLLLAVLYARSSGLCFRTAGALMLLVVATLLAMRRHRRRQV
mmetsp:Transcript_70481/g.178283  ORF Transcript_70481/g.178283 Transcript_70481/m.178283 type:complete len:544 (+) Transcript_70481:90-1721(+)